MWTFYFDSRSHTGIVDYHLGLWDRDDTSRHRHVREDWPFSDEQLIERNNEVPGPLKDSSLLSTGFGPKGFEKFLPVFSSWVTFDIVYKVK